MKLNETLFCSVFATKAKFLPTCETAAVLTVEEGVYLRMLLELGKATWLVRRREFPWGSQQRALGCGNLLGVLQGIGIAAGISS